MGKRVGLAASNAGAQGYELGMLRELAAMLERKGLCSANCQKWRRCQSAGGFLLRGSSRQK